MTWWYCVVVTPADCLPFVCCSSARTRLPASGRYQANVSSVWNQSAAGRRWRAAPATRARVAFRAFPFQRRGGVPQSIYFRAFCGNKHRSRAGLKKVEDQLIFLCTPSASRSRRGAIVRSLLRDPLPGAGSGRRAGCALYEEDVPRNACPTCAQISACARRGMEERKAPGVASSRKVIVKGSGNHIFYLQPQ